MPPSLPTKLTTILLKFDKTTVLVPATKKTKISDLKTDFLAALNATKTSPLNNTLEDTSSFQIFRVSRKIDNLTDNNSNGRSLNSWDALSDEHTTMSDLSIEEAETLGIGFRNSKGSYDPPVIEIWREQEVEQ